MSTRRFSARGAAIMAGSGGARALLHSDTSRLRSKAVARSDDARAHISSPRSCRSAPHIKAHLPNSRTAVGRHSLQPSTRRTVTYSSVVDRDHSVPKMKLTLTMFVATVAVALCAPLPTAQRPLFFPPVIVDAGTAIGGAGGDGGDASVVGAIVTGGIGGDGVSDSAFVANGGIIAGGDGTLDAVVGNGAVGTVIGSGSISGSVTNTAVAGSGGAGGSASA
eukprot:TRINITY_DN323_c0_g1_i1.p2 TRINITY_DN323_c0_g1~~TRINITY_DN323_c0_g1_i1.p2  ORF type:complete len:221 (-),score=57.01 TRINITY_DN323_c0_g1_i1:4490-5152(-)